MLRHGNDVIPADVDTVLVANSTMVVVHREQLRSWCPVVVVIDEAAAYKTATAARTKALYGDALDGAGGIVDEVPFVIAMSGTLAPAHNGELYPHLRALTPAALIDEHGRIMRRHVFEKTFCVFENRRIAGNREVQVIVGSRNSSLLRQRINPHVAHVTLREIAPTLPPERHELVPIAREDVKLEELAAIAGIEDPEIRTSIEALATAIRDGLVPESDVDREMTRLMQTIGGGAALAHLRRAYGMAKLPYVEDVVMSRRGGSHQERTPTLIFNTYRMTGDRLEKLLHEQDVVVGRIHGDTSAAARQAVISGNSERQRRGSNPADRRRRLGAQLAGRQPDHHARAELDAGKQPSGGRPRRAHRPVQSGTDLVADGLPLDRRIGDTGAAPQAGRPHRTVAGSIMMRLDTIKETIIEARRSEAAALPFPSGVAAGDNRTGFLNASEAGRCTRWLWFDRHGNKHSVAGETTHPPYGVFDRGHAFELWLVTYLAAGLARTGSRLLYAGTRQKRLVLSDFRLAGTPDGLIKWSDETESVLEVKSHGTAYNYDSGPSEMHVRQTELNIELFHETTTHRPEDGIIIYGLAEDYERLALHRVERRPAVFVEMLGKAVSAFDADNAAAVTAEGVVTKQCVICPHRSHCTAATMRAIPAAGSGGLDQETLHSIDRLVAARQRAVDAEEEAVRARAETEAEIVAALTDGGANRIKRNGYAVRLKTATDGFAVVEIRSA